MTSSFELVRKTVRLRAPLVAALVLSFAACDATETLDPTSSALPESAPEVLAVEDPSLASVSYAGGIPIGHFHQPTSLFGTYYNGALRNIQPNDLRSELAAIKSRGGKVMLMFVGAEKYYKDGSGHFSLTKWKARMDRFKGIDFSSYIKDGTVIGHFLIDEPNDPDNWGGRAIAHSTLEEMAKYSKARWPSLVTVVRAETSYMVKYSGTYRYVDAAWAQYLSRRGDVGDYIRRSVSEAQKKGLALVVGLNVLKGGKPNGTRMSASEVKDWGSALLSSSYPCAFVSWKYDSDFLSTSGMKDAMKYLRSKAQSHSFKTCRGS